MDEPENALSGALSSGDRPESLRQIRRVLGAALLEAESPREVAAVARELRDTIRELSQIDAPKKDQVDEVGDRRRKRLEGLSS